MGRGRNSRGEKEYTKLQQALHENKKLKKEIARLRNQLSRAFNAKPESFIEEDEKEEVKTHSVKKKKDRTCHHCGRGEIQFKEYSKFGGEQWYYRACNFCPHRTRGKKLTPEVDRE